MSWILSQNIDVSKPLIGRDPLCVESCNRPPPVLKQPPNHHILDGHFMGGSTKI